MMPRWLSNWIALTIGIIWAIVGYGLAMNLVAHGEPTFTRDQRAQLNEEYPGGTYLSDHAYKWCGGQEWFLVDPRGNWSSMGGSCIRWK